MRYKLNFNRKKLSEPELTRYMDFDKFISGAPASPASLLKSTSALKTLVITGAAMLVIAGYFFYHKTKNNRHGDNAFIDPPLDSVNIAYSAYIIDPAKDTTIVYRTGSSIHIPANAFVDEKGNTRKGKIEVRYREFNDPLEIFLSGIPMEYDSAGTVYHFESAGMFELLAFEDGRPVRIAKNIPLTVSMISHTTDDDYNIYYLDTMKQRWDYTGPNNKAGNTNMPLYDRTIAKEYEDQYSGSQEEPVYISKADPNKYSFVIDYSKEEFPELAMYDGVKFQVDAGERSYDPKLAQKIWQDVFIRRKDKKHYTVTFSRENEAHTFAVIPVMEEDPNRSFEQKMAEYTMSLNSRRFKEKQQQEIIRANYVKYMGEARWADVNSRINEMVQKYPVNYSTLALRTFNIPQTGIWNSDRPIDPIAENISPAELYDQDGNVLKAGKLSLIIKGRNMLCSHYVKDNRVAKFRYSHAGGNMLLAITTDGYPAYLGEEEFSKAVDKEGVLKFRMHVSNKKVQTVEELKELFNL